MAWETELNDDFVAGMVPVLKSPDVLLTLHEQAEQVDRITHFTHSALVGAMVGCTLYGHSVINAVNTGAMLYETLGANVGNPIPSEFALQIIADRERDPNFGLHLIEQMNNERARLVAEHPFLARALHELCEAQIKDFDTTGGYGLGAAAVMWASQREIQLMWRFEQELA